jgi:phenylpyruvate tautomerase PptA (4-oxalocrotonate tautomerase family)
MHSDYKTRLTALSDKLTDVVLEEADPDNWPGAGRKSQSTPNRNAAIGTGIRRTRPHR